MLVFRVQKHDTESEELDALSVWDDLEAAQAEYNSCVARYRAIGCTELESCGVDLAKGVDKRNVYARTVFENMDGSKTIFVLDTFVANIGGA